MPPKVDQEIDQGWPPAVIGKAGKLTYQDHQLIALLRPRLLPCPVAIRQGLVFRWQVTRAWCLTTARRVAVPKSGPKIGFRVGLR